MSLLNYEKTIENRVKDLSFNKSGRYGKIYQWEHRHSDFYVTVKRTSQGKYEVLKGRSERTMQQSPVNERFMFNSYEDAEDRAKQWMRNNPEPEEEAVI